MAEKEATERRVYVLPVELVERVRQYQKDNLIASEVEAVRRLLDTALHLRDDVHSLLQKMKTKYKAEKDIRVISRDVLALHPLIESIKISDGSIEFTMKNGGMGSFATDGEAYFMNKGQWNRELDDEIPF